MRISYIFSILILFSLTNFLSAKSASFSINCKIQDSIVITMDEGKSNRYKSWTGDVGTGDNINLNFVFEFQDREYYDFYKLKITSNIGVGSYTFQDVLSIADFDRFSNENLLFRGTDFIFSDNFISLDAMFGEVKLNRYYKNDWNLIFTQDRTDASEIKSANCLSVPNKYNEMLEVMRKQHS